MQHAKFYQDIYSRYFCPRLMSANMELKNIVFDLGGVLIDWNPRYLYRSYFECESEMEYFLENVCNQQWNERHDAGVSFESNARSLIERFPQYEEAIRLYDTGWEKMLGGEIAGTLEMLHALKNRGYKVYALSNWSAEKFPTALERFRFLGEMDGIVVSGREKVIKPDPRIFEILLERYGLSARESVFIDDNQRNVESARRLSMTGIRFETPQKLSEQLVRLGVL